MYRTSPNSCYTKTSVLIETLISSQHNVGATSKVLRNVTQFWAFTQQAKRCEAVEYLIATE